MMGSFEVKALCAVLLWAISVAFGVLLPYFIWNISPKRRLVSNCNIPDSSGDDEVETLISQHRRRQNEDLSCSTSLTKSFTSHLRRKLSNGKFSSSVHCLCGGVFLGVSLLDLIPQSRTAVEDVLQVSQIATSYPVAEFMVTFGLLLVMTVEKILTESLHSNADTASSNLLEESADESAGRSLKICEKVTRYRMFILVATLSLHSIFEGLAIGLQEELTTLVQLVVAVSVHKAVLSFGIGMSLLETFGSFQKVYVAVACAMIFCTASPIGCLAGAFISENDANSSEASLIASAVLQCLATGTFLYVTFLEVIPREFSHHGGGRKQKRANSCCSVTENTRCDDSSSSRRNQGVRIAMERKGLSGLLKLLALITGFGIAAGLQFL